MTSSVRGLKVPIGEADLGLQDTFYTSHLAIVNDIQGVVASENICNAQGQLLVSKGASIDAKTTERILKFKLLKPIEDSISIEDQITGAGLYQRLENHFSRDTSLQELWQRGEHQFEIDEFCARACQYNLIAQKLTVLALRYPTILEQALFCAWFCAQLQWAKKTSEEQAYQGFLAGLCHDIGMLHIDSAVINSDAELTEAQWRQVYAHPIIGFRILSALKDFPKDVSAAVLEHHENLDGSGYPRHKVASELGELGKLLNLSDSINAIYRKHLKPRSRSLQDIVPIIQMNLDSRFDRTANKAIVMLRQLQCSAASENLNQDMQDFVSKLDNFKENIEAFIETTQHYNQAIG
ncbi:MAG TPA: HD domain-containing phosphohydrolase, partial [Marinagarivorans sp.]